MEINIQKCEYRPNLGFKEEWYYKDKQGNIVPYLREDIERAINPLKPATFSPFLELFDIPYFEEVWLDLVRKCNERSRRTVFGDYLSKMKLKGYRGCSFKDTPPENFLNIEYYIEVLRKPTLNQCLERG